MRSAKSFLWILVAGLGLTPGLAQATDGLCYRVCNGSFRECLYDAGCRYQSCNGGTCSASGRCSNGGVCGMVGCSPAAAACFETRSTCLVGCRDWFPSLWSIELFDVDELTRVAMLDSLKAMEADIKKLTAQIEAVARQHLGTYRENAESLYRRKQLDFATSWGLQEIARQAEASLSSARLDKMLLEEGAGFSSGKDPADRPSSWSPDTPEICQ